MFARRNFLYKHSHNGAHPHLAARDSSVSAGLEKVVASPASPSTSSDPITTDPVTPVTPVPVSQTTPTSSSPVTSSLSTPATSTSSSSSSSSSPASTSSASKSSSATSTAPSTASTLLTVASPTTAHAPSVTTQVVPGVSLTSSSALSPTTTSSADSSSGPSTTTIVGGVAGALAGIAVLGFLLMWCMRRQRNRDVDDFDAQAFKRQSAVLVDDPVEPYNPRPPTMFERHNASPALAAQAGQGGQNFYGSFGGYSQQPPYAPPEVIQPTGSPPPQVYGAPPMGYTSYNDPQQRIARQPSNVGHAAYDSQPQLARQPSNAEYLTRQPSYAVGYAPPTVPPGSFDPNAQYIDLDRSSISPYQAAQYADISRQLGTTDSNADVPRESLVLPDGPLPSPFDDPVEATLVPDTSPHRPPNVAAPGRVTAAPQTQGNATEPHQRPATVYEDGDAYGGI